MPVAQTEISLPDRYRVVRHVANGGMASVWAAEDRLLTRLVAVKVLNAALSADASARRRFTREARAAARVSGHPNVVTIYDIGEHDGQAFIVMEHFAGGTLSAMMKAPEPVPTPTALRWLGEAAAALDAAHAADVVHRDVKPGNLLLDDRGRLAVGDFGIASLAGESQLTQTGQVVGTAAYLSPEQARGEAATAASDRYSLAVVAYELLCGKRPFGGDTPMAQLSARLHTDPPVPDGPCAAAAEALTHGLARDPAERPETATAFVEELRDAIGDAADPPTAETRIAGPLAAGALADPDGTAAYAAEDVPRFTREEPVTPRTPRPARVPAAAAAGAAGAGAAAAAHAAERTPPPPPPPAAGPAPGDEGGRRAFPVALAAGLATALAIGVVAVAGGGGDDGGSGERASTADRPARTTTGSDRSRTTQRTSTQDAPAAAAPAPEPEPQTTQRASSADGRTPAQLNDAGFARLQAGDAAGAVPLLQRSVEGFRAAGDTSSTAYSYALFNLGSALRRSGRPAEAIPYLQERLDRFDDRDAIVAAELQRAQQEAGVAPTGGDGDSRGNGNGKAKGKEKDD